jgi:hypothetical protein
MKRLGLEARLRCTVCGVSGSPAPGDDLFARAQHLGQRARVVSFSTACDAVEEHRMTARTHGLAN